jgi:hypothetical protein
MSVSGTGVSMAASALTEQYSRVTQVIAKKDGCALHEGAQIKLRCRARVELAQVSSGNRRAVALVAWQDYRLHSREHLARPVARDCRAGAVCEGFEEGRKLYPAVDRELRHLIDAEAS